MSSLRILAAGLLLCALFAASPAAAQERLAATYQIVVQVADPEASAEAVIEEAKKCGGYFTSRREEGVVFRIPREELKGFLDFATGQGVLLSREYQAENLGARFMELEASLKAKEDVRKQYSEVMRGATDATIFLVEQEMAKLIGEIERLKGALRLVSHQAQFAEVKVYYRFNERTPPRRDGRSSFPWLNTLNLSDLLGAF